MTTDVDSWMSAISSTYGDIRPDFDWMKEISDDTQDLENQHFQSFHRFIDFPVHYIGMDVILEGRMIADTENGKNRAKKILNNLDYHDFSEVANYSLISFALRLDKTLLRDIPAKSNIVKFIWCLCQVLEADNDYVLQIWNQKLMRPPPFDNKIGLTAILLSLETCLATYQEGAYSPITSDNFEVIFALAYCKAPVNVRQLSKFIIPHVTPFIAESNAAHLLFRRMLPYCAMENIEGRRCALDILEQVLGHHTHFPSCLSTWISIHPYCVAASNNLLVDIEQKGLTTTQMKTLLKQIKKLNDMLSKKQITLTDAIRAELPRSLWRVEFPPPSDEVEHCNRTCDLILAGFGSKKRTIIPYIVILILAYLVYIFM